MSGKWGGGGTKCTACDKTAYPAETVMFEKAPYHVECFRCENCNKKMDLSQAAKYEGKVYDKQCFQKLGFANKQRKVVWTKKEPTGEVTASKFGGGGTKCALCEKTVYSAEAVNFEKKIYHADCCKCTTCSKKCSASELAIFEDSLYCHKCFKDGGFARKQTKTTTTGEKKESSSKFAGKFGGGGNKCYRCDKTVYPAETLQFEKKYFHAQCFTCLGFEDKECRNPGRKLTSSNAKYKKTNNGEDLSIYCQNCWDTNNLGRATLNPTAAE